MHKLWQKSFDIRDSLFCALRFSLCDDIYILHEDIRDIKDEKNRRKNRTEKDEHQATPNRGFSTESVAWHSCGTINRHGQLLESTSRVQFAAPHQRVVRWTRVLAGRKRDKGNEESPREAEGWEGLSRHSPHAILHTPLSVLYSTLLHYAGTAYKRRVVPTPEPPDANRPMSIRLLVVLAVCNSDKH